MTIGVIVDWDVGRGVDTGFDRDIGGKVVNGDYG